MSSLLKGVILIIIIVIILWLGHVPYFQHLGRNLYTEAESYARVLWQSGVDFWNQHILGRVSSEIEKRQNIVKKEINGQVQQVGQTIWEKIKNYFSGLISGILGQTNTVTNK